MAKAVKTKRNIKNKGWLRRHANVDTKKDILKASGALFARQGFYATSVVNIASAVGIKDASIYNHFKSKQEILYAFLCEVLGSLVDECSTALAIVKNQSASKKLRTFVEAHVSFQVDNLEVTPMVDAYTYQSIKVLTNEQYSGLVQYERTIFNLLKSILQEGVEENEFEIDDLTVTLFAILGSIEHLVYWYDPAGRLSKKSLQKKLADHAMLAVKAGS